MSLESSLSPVAMYPGIPGITHRYLVPLGFVMPPPLNGGRLPRRVVRLSQEVEFIIPEEAHSVVTFRQQEHPGIALINRALVGFAPRIVFRWHLSIMFELKDLIDNGMPSLAERAILDPFGDQLGRAIKSDDERPNALFLARVTWNASRELIYRVHDPEPVNDLLQRIVRGRSYPRDFDFQLDDDPDWNLTNWHLGTALR